MTDGGYYAIKGFEFQIDKTILSILSSDYNTPVCLEQIQDINTNGYVVQVKYRETQNYAPSKIRDPVIQLISEFLKEPSRTYYLYCYFKDKQETTKILSLKELDDILGSKKDRFDESTKADFLLNFELQFSKSFQEQFELAIKEIEILFACSSFDESLIHYGCITNYLRKIVTIHSDISRRTCTKKELLELISANRKIIFDSAYRIYKGKESYFSFVRKQHFVSRNIDNWERFFIIELLGTENISLVKSIIINIKEKFYIKRARAIKSGAPYFFLDGISASSLKLLKKELIADGNIIKDGHDFKDADFNSITVTEKSTLENEISIKFLNSLENLNEIISLNLGTHKKIYQFYLSKPFETKLDIDIVCIEIEDISEVGRIIV